MKSYIPRLRMFAGPNGSGKSTIKSEFSPEFLGVYVNPDEIETTIRHSACLDLKQFQIDTTTDEMRLFFEQCNWIDVDTRSSLQELRVENCRIVFGNRSVNFYHASVLAEFFRQKLLEKRISFSFETVMSVPDKVELLKAAQAAGYRTYLYYVATIDPMINVSRVKSRVEVARSLRKKSKVDTGARLIYLPRQFVTRIGHTFSTIQVTPTSGLLRLLKAPRSISKQVRYRPGFGRLWSTNQKSEQASAR